MARRDIPDALKKQQELKRQETLNKIKDAIEEIQFEDGIVTKKKLIELTGLSNSTFSKPHVKKLLKERKVCQYRETMVVQEHKWKNDNDSLNKKIDKLKRENIKLKNDIVSKEIKINMLEEELKEKEDKYRRLLGRVHQLTRIAEANGIDLEKIL